MLYFIAVLIIAVAAAISSSRKEPLDCEKAREQGFWHDELSCQRIAVFDQMSPEFFCPSNFTSDYAKHAKAIWSNLVSPVIGSHVDSLLTSEDS